MEKLLKKISIICLSMSFLLTGCSNEEKKEVPQVNQNTEEGAVTIIDAVTDEDEEALKNGEIDETIKGDVLVNKATFGSKNTKARNLTAKECETVEKELVRLINEERSTKVSSHKKLESSSLVRTKELKKKFSHTRPNKKSWSTTLTAAKVNMKGNSSGENLANLMISAKSSYSQTHLKNYASMIHKCLMGSTTHKKVIKNTKYKFVGISIYTTLSKGRVTFYIAQHFTKKC